MSLPTRLTAYPIEKQILDQVVATPGDLAYELPTEGKAIAFLQRAYYYRKLCAQLGQLEYEGFSLRRVKNVVHFIKLAQTGVLRTQEGEALSPEPAVFATPPIQTAKGEALTPDFIAQSIQGLDLDFGND
jgi:hypothetical protein